MAILAMIFGIIYTAMPLAIVGSYFFDAYDKQKKVVKSRDDVLKLLKTKIPDEASHSVDWFEQGCLQTDNQSFPALTQVIRESIALMGGEAKPRRNTFISNLIKTQDKASSEESKTKTENETVVDSKPSSPYVISNPGRKNLNVSPFLIKRVLNSVGHQQMLLSNCARIIHFIAAENTEDHVDFSDM